jgi:RNA polymerase sigma-70 factor (ECF subfamily)
MEGVLARDHETRAVGAMAPGASAADDAALLAGVVRGDAHAFRSLVARHLPPVLAVARRMLRDDAEAEDVAQEAMLRLWRTGASVELGSGGLKPWLRRVASNLCIDRMRATGRLTVTDELPEQEVAPEQVATLVGKDLAARVAAALQALPDRQRIALTLFHYEGLSQIEVGRAMGVSDEAVESLLGRARRTLKSLLKDDWRELLPDPTD